MTVEQQRSHRLIRGTIAYTSGQASRLGAERGREYFTIAEHGDGRRTVNAHCEIDDAPSVMRDIVFAVDDSWWPLDCSVRLSVGDRFTGSGWLRIDGREAECESVTATEGRISQRMSMPAPPAAFVTHAIVTDGWLMRCFDLQRGDELQTIAPILLPSPDHRGATGPLLFRVDARIRFLGAEDVTVGAGAFAALHFQIVSAPGLPQAHPEYDIWCTADGSYLFLKGAVGGYMETSYELTELAKG